MFILNPSTHLIENTFLNGLKEDIVVKNNMFKHPDLTNMMNLEQLIEE